MNVFILIIVFIIMLAGVAGSVVPVIPSTPIILIAAVGYGWYDGFTEITWGVIGVLLVLTIVSQALDYLAGVYGAKKMGATKWGMIGSVVGAVAGMFFGLPGIVIGPFVGAVLGEMLVSGRDFNASMKSGFGTFLGLLGGSLGKFIIAMMMIAVFVISLF